MAVAVAIVALAGVSDPSAGIDQTSGEQIIDGTLTLSGNYGAVSPAHGDPLSFASLGDKIKSNSIPRQVLIREDQGAGNAPLGYTFLYAHGTTRDNGKLVVLGTPASGGALVGATEYTQGTAYSSGTPSLDAAVLRFRAFFNKFV